MLLNELKMIFETDREGFVSSTLSDLGVSLHRDTRGTGNTKDVHSALHDVMDDFVVNDDKVTSVTDKELLAKFRGSATELKSSLANVQAILKSMETLFVAGLEKPGMDVVASSSIHSPLPTAQAWIAALIKEKAQLSSNPEVKAKVALAFAQGKSREMLIQHLMKSASAITFAKAQSAGILKMVTDATAAKATTDPKIVYADADLKVLAFMSVLSHMEQNTEVLMNTVKGLPNTPAPTPAAAAPAPGTPPAPKP